MENNILLSLDLSTTCTGYAIFDIDSKKLIRYGTIKSIAKGLSKLKYPEQQLRKIESIVSQLVCIIEQITPTIIVIEEINLHKSRMSGKTLDCLHGILWYMLPDRYLKIIVYLDSDGLFGWRTKLKLRLTEADKINNRENKKVNKKLKKGTTKVPIINKKHLAQRFVNSYYHTTFDLDNNTSDGDIVDSIGLGHAYLYFSMYK